MKTINLETAIKLAPYLEDEEIEYFYYNWKLFDDFEFSSYSDNYIDMKWEKFKAPTLDELIEFIWKRMSHQKFIYRNGWIWNLQTMFWPDLESDSLIWVYEKFALYIINNDIL